MTGRSNGQTLKGGTMAEYTSFAVRADGQPVTNVLYAFDDAEAIARARRLNPAGPIELWRGQRLVIVTTGNGRAPVGMRQAGTAA